MSDAKHWYQSKTVWGGMIALTGAIASLFGVEMDAATNALATDALTDAAIAVGSLLAIFGRFQADRPLR